MKRWVWMIGALGWLLAACTLIAEQSAPPAESDAPPAPQPETAVPTPLPDGPLAPDLTHDVWLNTEPLTTADLRGNVVLIDFWTFG